ncbi:MAG: hypothetical protein KF762_04705 [Acidobacteria bacterium]|nr:hypothetical protein [Acidobacteriota bacterium]
MLALKDIFIGFETWNRPHYGIGTFEILNHIARYEYKYVERNPRRFVVPKYSGKYALFLASVFGEWSADILESFENGYAQFLGSERPEVSIDDFTDYFEQGTLYPSRMTAYTVNVRGASECILFLDATNFIDIVHYWNLRALGFHVIPIAKQDTKSSSMRDFVIRAVERNFRPSNYPGSWCITAYESSSTPFLSSPAEDYFAEIGIPFRQPIKDGESSKDKVIFSYLPLVGDEAFERNFRPSVNRPIAKEARFRFADTPRLEIRLPNPEFLHSGIRSAAYANDIDLTLHHDRELMAEAIPEGDRVMAVALDGFNFPDFRFRAGKITYLATFADETLVLKPPKAEDIFFRWFQNSSFDTNLSPAGRIGKQMLRSLGGINGIWLLRNKQMFDLLHNDFRKGNLNQSEDEQRPVRIESKPVSYKNLIGKLKKISNTREAFWRRSGDNLLQELIKANVIQLGVELNCTFCNQPSWHSIDDLDYQIKCPNCLEVIDLPTYAPDKQLIWAYRTIGAFSPATSDYGSYSVLLTLGFFSRTLNRRTTPIFGLEIWPKAEKQSSDNKTESDLALFFCDDSVFVKRPDLIFAECKTYNKPFSEKDISTMTQLSERFPGSYLVFSTLETQLDAKEKKLIRAFSKQLGKKDPSYLGTKLLILTGTELYSEKKPPYCWEGTLDNIPEHAHAILMNRHLLGLCELTQKIYLAD